MENVSRYYRQKAHIEAPDEYLERINEGDIDIMRKALGYVVIAPFVSVGAMYLAKLVKRDYSMSENFVYSIRRMQDRFVSSNYSYGRSAASAGRPEPIVPGSES